MYQTRGELRESYMGSSLYRGRLNVLGAAWIPVSLRKSGIEAVKEDGDGHEDEERGECHPTDRPFPWFLVNILHHNDPEKQPCEEMIM